MRYLLLISLYLSGVSCVCTREVPVTGALPVGDSGHLFRYQARITAGRSVITGLFVVKHARGEWRGSLINEFGIKAFDFIVVERRCRLLNTTPFLDKWYIRRTLGSDLAFLCAGGKPKGRRVERSAGGTVILTHEKRHIEYLLQPMTR
ncbi:MAG: hypothetical protein LBP56_03395 [Odoribacteraceae bacterium]|jgi:hypothetical protein|nr:hypothetical protein [Odoribacteraceae bacterium]